MIKNVTLTIHIRCEYSPVMFSATAPMTSLYVIICHYYYYYYYLFVVLEVVVVVVVVAVVVVVVHSV